MKKVFILIGFPLFLLFISCTKDTKWERSMNDTGYNINELRTKVLYEGDTNAYYYLSIEYLDYEDGRTALLPYSIIMANRTNDYYASYNTFVSLSLIYKGDKVDSIDETTAKMAIEYLEKSAQAGGEQAIQELNKLPKDNTYLTYKEKFRIINR